MWSFYTLGNWEIRRNNKIMARQAKMTQYRVGTKKHGIRPKKSGKRASGTTIKQRRKV